MTDYIQTREFLRQRREKLLEEIANASNEIKVIDRKLESLDCQT